MQEWFSAAGTTFFCFFSKGLLGLSMFDTYSKTDDIDRVCFSGTVFCSLARYAVSN